MKCAMPCRLVGVLVLLSAATIASTHAAADDHSQKLPPGKTPGTFHLIYRGTVGFTMKAEFPTVVSIGDDLTGTLATMKVTNGEPFTIEVDLAPGTYWINSDPAGDPAKSDYQQVNGGMLHIEQHGNLSFPLAGMPLLHARKMSELSPARDEVADFDPAVLKWTRVEGAMFYRGSYRAGTEWKDFKTEALSFTLPHLKPGVNCTWEIYAQDAQDQTIASGSASFSAHGTIRPAGTQPAPNDGFLGVILASSGDSGDRFWAAFFNGPGATTRPVETVSPDIKVTAVMPDSPALKADLRPGDLIVAINGKPAAADIRAGSEGGAVTFVDQIRAEQPGTDITLTIRRDENELKRRITVGPTPPWLTGGVEHMSGLSPDKLEVAETDPTVLRWTPVAGAKRYEGAFLSGGLGRVFQTDTASYTLPPLQPPNRCDWWVCAIDEKGRTLANGRAEFLPYGTDPLVRMFPAGGYLGIMPSPSAVTEDPGGTHRLDKGGVMMSPGPTIPCIEVMSVMPGSPALKADIRPGDWIIAVDGKAVAKRKEQGVETGDVQALGDQIRATKPGTVVTLTIRRDSKELKIPVTIAWAPGQVNSPTTRSNPEEQRK